MNQALDSIINDTAYCCRVLCPNDSLAIMKDNLALVIEKASSDEKIFGLSSENARILIPVLVTFSIFLLGIIINYIFKKYERRSYLSSIKSVIITWCKLLKNPANQQSKNCISFVTRLKKSTEMQPERIDLNNLLAVKLHAMELKDQIDTVVINHSGKDSDKSKCLFNIISQVGFLFEIEKELRTKYESYHQDSLKCMDEWNEAYKKLYNLRTSLRIQYNKTTDHPMFPFYQEIDAVFRQFVKMNPKGGDINIFTDQLFNPISDICNEYINRLPDQHEMYLVAFVIQELFTIIKKWNANRLGTSEVFSEFANNLDASVKELERNIEILDKMKFKFILKIK